MANSIFVSYRRGDSQHAALALVEALTWEFADGEVFLDHLSIEGGELWERKLQQGLDAASVVVAVIGPGWLRAQDEYGRRRIDRPDDWVRREIVTGLKRGVPVVPVLLDDVPPLVPAALDDELAALARPQCARLRADSWRRDMDDIVRALRLHSPQLPLRPRADARELNPNGVRSFAGPQPEPGHKGEPVLEPDALRKALDELPGWRVEENFHPWAVAGQARELTRVYVFKSFKSATRFMAEVAGDLHRHGHHPRWENQWRTVRVWFTTWDTGCKITRLDVESARLMDQLYEQRDRQRCP